MNDERQGMEHLALKFYIICKQKRLHSMICCYVCTLVLHIYHLDVEITMSIQTERKEMVCLLLTITRVIRRVLIVTITMKITMKMIMTMTSTTTVMTTEMTRNDDDTNNTFFRSSVRAFWKAQSVFANTKYSMKSQYSSH